MELVAGGIRNEQSSRAGRGINEAVTIHLGTLSEFAGPLQAPAKCRALDLPKGSMGPKLMAACDFAENGGVAGIGRLADALDLLTGTAGTMVFGS